jgi:ABC-type antimicrobial peptide transport system permease subunit
MAEGRLLSGNREIMIGRPAAALLQVGVGDIVRLKDVGFRVVGIFETGVTWEEGSGIISLRDAQALFGKPRQVTMLYINIDDPQQAESLRQTIQSAFPEIAVAPSSEFVESGPEMQSMNAMMWAISAMAILVGGIGMANTMFMSVFERTREIGTLRALGWRRRRVLWAVLKESFVLSLIGVLIGVAFSALLSFTLRLIPMWGEALTIILSGALLLQALIIALALGALGGLYPAWRASKLSPVEALRYE